MPDRSATWRGAWLVKCALEQGNSLEASNTLNKLLDLRISEVAAAQRLARDFELQFIWLDFEGARQYPPLARKTPLQKLQILAEKARRWVALYPTAAKTPDGYGVRFEWARALFMQAEQYRDPKEAKLRDALYQDAQKILGTLTEKDNDFAEPAVRISTIIGLRTYNEKTSPADLHTFDQWFLRGPGPDARPEKAVRKAGRHGQEGRSRQAAPIGRRQATRTRPEHPADPGLADASTPALKLEEARFDLLIAYLMMNDPYRAAIAGEARARAKPLTKRAAQAAAYAVRAYGDIMSQDPSESNRARLRDLIDTILGPECQQLWAQEPVTGIARYHRALLCQRDAAELALEAEQLPDEAKAAKLRVALARYREAIESMRNVPQPANRASGLFLRSGQGCVPGPRSSRQGPVRRAAQGIPGHRPRHSREDAGVAHGP